MDITCANIFGRKSGDYAPLLQQGPHERKRAGAIADEVEVCWRERVRILKN